MDRSSEKRVSGVMPQMANPLPVWDADIVALLNSMRWPPVVVIADLLAHAGEVTVWRFSDRRNRKAISRWMNRCGYMKLRNPDATDGLWFIRGARQTLYTRMDIAEGELVETVRRFQAGFREWVSDESLA